MSAKPLQIKVTNVMAYKNHNTLNIQQGLGFTGAIQEIITRHFKYITTPFFFSIHIS
jgi:hypothetical protein